MGEDLKKTGAGNLFTVFGEPDIELRDTQDGQVVVDLKGVDVYDPTTGEVRSNDTSQIALWMIDTNYNEESFFVRHCYFTGRLACSVLDQAGLTVPYCGPMAIPTLAGARSPSSLRGSWYLSGVAP